jgi:hypothetical protein
MNHTRPLVNNERNGIGLKFSTLLIFIILIAVNKEDVCRPMKKNGPADLKVMDVKSMFISVFISVY